MEKAGIYFLTLTKSKKLEVYFQQGNYWNRIICVKHGIIQSMSKKGNCYDNSIMETFFEILKKRCTMEQHIIVIKN